MEIIRGILFGAGVSLTSIFAFFAVDILITLALGSILNKMEILDTDDKEGNKLLMTVSTVITVGLFGIGLIIISTQLL